MSITFRPFGGVEDELALYAVLREAELPGLHDVDVSARLAIDALDPDDVRLAIDDNRPVGFAIVSSSARFLEVEVTARSDAPKLRAELLDWGVARLVEKKRRSRDDREVVVFASLGGFTPDREDLFRARGFTPNGLRFTRFERTIAEPTPNVTVPASLELRPLRDHETESFLAVQRSLPWGTAPSIDALRRLRTKPGWREDLELVVASKVDGAIVAYGTGWLEETRGHIDRIGVDLTYRRLGLARALTLQLLRNFRAHGRTHVFGMVSDLAPFARDLYLSLGATARGVVDYHYRVL